MQADSVHPEAQAVLDRVEALDVFPLNQHGPQGARDLMEELRPSVEGPSIGDVSARTVPGYDGGPEVPIRVYRPAGDGPFPTVVFLHGGGFVLGNLDSHDLVCRHLCRESEAVVVAAAYRLAPESPFPAGLEDAFAVTEWAAQHPDEVDGDGQLAVAGDSAGGTLAAGVTLMARDRGGPAVDYQLLVYPSVSVAEDWDSMDAFATGYYLQAEDMHWFHDCYFSSDVHEANPYATPLAACDHAGLPPATVLTAGFDPLRDEGVAYVEALEADGVDVTHRHYDDMIHGFFSMLAEPARLERGHEAVADVAGDLREALA